MTTHLDSARLFVLALALVACGPPAAEDDAGGRRDAGAPAACTEDADCDDGRWCTGEERCVESFCEPGDAPDCGDGVTCSVDRCDEARRACVSEAPDLDGDGAGDAQCLALDGVPLGSDCDDGDAARFAGNVERCDAAGVDEDCDPTTLGREDLDGDGVVSARCCNDAACGGDCDDTRVDVRPGATEVCNGLDEDCDGMVDEGLGVAGFDDLDADGRGDPTSPRSGCLGQVRFTEIAGDCDDDDPTRYEGAAELCDGVDNDCDAEVDENPVSVDWFVDADGDGYGDPEGERRNSCAVVPGFSPVPSDCDDSSPTVNPAAAEQCNGVDDDCNGAADYAIGVNDTEDDDGDGAVDAACGGPEASDCDDTDASTSVGAGELCDGRDNDCDGAIDEDAARALWFRDLDGDGFGSAQSGTRVSCTGIAGYVARGGDCDDRDRRISPSAREVCNGVDDDCDGRIDPSSAPLCGASGSCVAGRCELGCDADELDCDGDPDNGCEVSRLTDPLHCGACGVSCGVGGLCTGGVCGGISQLAQGEDFACALQRDSAVVCWGNNNQGALGRPVGAPGFSHVPLVIDLPDVPERIAAGDDHACAQLRNNRVYCWGRDNWGQNGRGNISPSVPRLPGLVGGGHSFDRLAVGAQHTCAVTLANEVYCWGANASGQLGTGSFSTYSAVPAPVSVPQAQSVALGAAHSCIVTFNDEQYCWGDGSSARFGLTAPGGPFPTQLAFEGFAPRGETLSAGGHGCARDRDTRAWWCWGQNFDGAAAPGNPATFLEAAPLDPALYVDLYLVNGRTAYIDARGAVMISSAAGFVPAPGGLRATRGSVHSQGSPDTACFVREGHSVYCWGRNNSGQCGVDPARGFNVAVPQRVEGL